MVDVSFSTTRLFVGSVINYDQERYRYGIDEDTDRKKASYRLDISITLILKQMSSDFSFNDLSYNDVFHRACGARSYSIKMLSLLTLQRRYNWSMFIRRYLSFF